MFRISGILSTRFCRLKFPSLRPCALANPAKYQTEFRNHVDKIIKEQAQQSGP